jgi:ribosomal protein S6--L-glutamate ligase
MVPPKDRLKIAILSREPKSYSTRRLKEACKLKGHRVRILDTKGFAIHVSQDKPFLYYKNRKLEKFDAIIPRIGAGITSFGTSIVRQFEKQKVFCLNSANGIMDSRDKLRAIQILSKHKIGLPPTVFVSQKESIMSAIESLGGAPVVIKLLEGTQGMGVILAETDNTAEAIVQAMHSTKQNVLIQQFIKESKGKDVRAIVVGGKVVAAMRRSAKGNEFRSNVHMGGMTETIELPKKYAQTAIKAAQILGLKVAGVDMLESDQGPLVMEVNSSPGLQGIEEATGLDVAGQIIDYLEDQAPFPEVDIRQRLTSDHGYGVAEIPVTRKSDLRNKTIKETELKKEDVVILSVIQENDSIPNPPSDYKIRQGDYLLCYGKLSSLKSYLKRHKTNVRIRSM